MYTEKGPCEDMARRQPDGWGHRGGGWRHFLGVTHRGADGCHFLGVTEGQVGVISSCMWRAGREATGVARHMTDSAADPAGQLAPSRVEGQRSAWRERAELDLCGPEGRARSNVGIVRRPTSVVRGGASL